eukprot:scaffold76316_cov22-Cyclotella_meneghiniana.AAC.1
MEEYVMREFIVMFGIDTKQSKSVSHEAINSHTEPNSPRNETRHPPHSGFNSLCPEDPGTLSTQITRHNLEVPTYFIVKLLASPPIPNIGYPSLSLTSTPCEAAPQS